MPKSIEQELVDAQVALDNVLASKPMQMKLNTKGYDLKKIREGKAKCENTILLQSVQQKEYGAQLKATKALRLARQEAEAVFAKQVAIARVVFKNDPDAFRTLQLSAKGKRSFAAWQKRAGIFYTNAPAYLTELEAHGITQAELDRGKAMTEAVLSSFGQRKQGKGKAQQSTRNRDAALADLKAWMKDFLAIARVALKDDEEHMEAVGLVVR